MQNALIAIAAFAPMLVLLVVIHEWGHFITARAFGVKVLEFGIGYPPRVCGFHTGKTPVKLDANTQYVNLDSNSPAGLQPGQFVRLLSRADAAGNLVAALVERADHYKSPLSKPYRDQFSAGSLLQHSGRIRSVNPAPDQDQESAQLRIADQLYSLNWLPIGGFVNLAGENDPAVPRGLAARGRGPRALILAAGSGMNLLFPLFAFALLFLIPQETVVGQVIVTRVADQSPAQTAGLQVGDRITHAEGRPIERNYDLIQATHSAAGNPVSWQIERQGQAQTVRLTPRNNPPPDQGPTGIQISLVNRRVETRQDPPWATLDNGRSNTEEMLIRMQAEFSAWFSQSELPQLFGPVGMAQLTGDITQLGGLRGWIMISMLFSINLAILNLLPIPLLDGGRLAMVGLEWLRGGQRISTRREVQIHAIGFVLLLVFILTMTCSDMGRLLDTG